MDRTLHDLLKAVLVTESAGFGFSPSVMASGPYMALDEARKFQKAPSKDALQRALHRSGDAKYRRQKWKRREQPSSRCQNAVCEVAVMQ